MSLEPCENWGYRRFTGEQDVQEEKGGSGIGQEPRETSRSSDNLSHPQSSGAKAAAIEVKQFTAGGCRLTMPLTTGQRAFLRGVFGQYTFPCLPHS